MTQIEQMKSWLEALEYRGDYRNKERHIKRQEAIKSIRQAIEQAEKQEPVIGTKTWFDDGRVVTQHLHPSDIYKDPQPNVEQDKFHENWQEIDCPICGELAKGRPKEEQEPKREPLTDEQIIDLWPSLIMHQHTYAFARAIEAAHNIKE